MKLGDILKDAAVEGKEKHVPVIEKGADSVTILVGKETPHPNTMEHHIDWVKLVGIKEDGQAVDLGNASFAPTYTTPTATFKVNLEGFKTICALSYCNIHGLWESSLDL